MQCQGGVPGTNVEEADAKTLQKQKDNVAKVSFPNKNAYLLAI